MIVDCYTHVWDSPAQLGRLAASGGRVRPALPETPDQVPAGVTRHRAAAEPVEVAFVVGFKSDYLEADIPNDLIAAYVRSRPGRLVGFAAVDPSNPKEALQELERAKGELALKGLALAPAAQDFHPTSSPVMQIYAAAVEARLPIIFHPGVQISAATKLEYAQPLLLDEVAREFPQMRIVIAHLGHPWMSETILLLAKHEHVYADLSWVLSDPWQAYQALRSAHAHGVMDKLLFGSGFPFASAAQAIDQVYSLPQLVLGTNLPPLPRDALRGIVERRTLRLLGLPEPQQPTLDEEDHTDVSADA